MNLSLKNIIFLVPLLVMSLQVNAQKVGVVLSGGGGRGLAHIGVLKALEDNNIPIDYIAGTSMGAIIGGLYASGYTPDQIENLFVSDKMHSWVTSGNRSTYYFKNPETNASWQIFKITYDSVVRAKLPSNSISPIDMDLGFVELFSGTGAAAHYNFDSLFVPFRCVSSDITHNRAVILKKGQLDKAIRASMTFPFYFTPIKINGVLMFDGGMYDNFPVDVMENEFHPDVIIGSKAASNYGPPRADDIISLVQSMLMINSQYTVDTTNGILIEPDIWSVGITDFSIAGEFIDSGYVATVRQLPKIRERIKSKENFDERTKMRKDFLSQIPPLRIGDIAVTGINKKQEVYVNRVLQKSKTLKILQDESTTKEQTTSIFKNLYYKLLSEQQISEVSPGLVYDTVARSYKALFDLTKSNKMEAEIGGLVSSRAINEVFFQMQYKLWNKNAYIFTGNAYLGRFHNSVHLQSRMDIPATVPLAFTLSYNVNGWNYFKTNTYFFEDKNPSYLLEIDHYWNLSIGVPIGSRAKLNAEFLPGRIKYLYYQTNQFTRADTADETTFEFYSPGLIFEMNSLNRKQYASSGTMLRLCGRLISGTEKNVPGSTSADSIAYTAYHNWFQVRFVYDSYFNRIGPFTPGIYAQVTLTNKPFFNNYTSSVLSAPAFEPIPESQTFFQPEFRAHNYGAFGAKLIINVFKNIDMRLEGYAFQPYKEILRTENNKAKDGEPFSNRYYMGSGMLVYHAPFGPLSMSLNYYDQAEENLSFSVNIGFYIFNKKPFQ